MSAINSHAAYMREYRKRKLLEDNCNNVPKRTKLNAERQREYRETHTNLYVEYTRNYRKSKAQVIKTQAGSSRAACMREYRKRKRLEEGSCNNVHKRTKLNAERQREYRETHKTYLLNTCIITENAKLRKYIYSSTNPNLITFTTLILGTKVPATFYFIFLAQQLK
jgi:L-rhamnose mutarotase